MVKPLQQMVVAFAMFFVAIITERFIRGHTWQLKNFHQAVPPAGTDVDARITLKDIGKFE